MGKQHRHYSVKIGSGNTISAAYLVTGTYRKRVVKRYPAGAVRYICYSGLQNVVICVHQSNGAVSCTGRVNKDGCKCTCLIYVKNFSVVVCIRKVSTSADTIVRAGNMMMKTRIVFNVISVLPLIEPVV